MKTLITILLSISILSCERQNHEKNSFTEKLKSENELLKRKNDSLKNELYNLLNLKKTRQNE